MAQQTLLRVKTNRINPDVIVPEGSIDPASTNGNITINGSGTPIDPYTGITTGALYSTAFIGFDVKNTGGIVNFQFSGNTNDQIEIYVNSENISYTKISDSSIKSGYFNVENDQNVGIYYEDVSGATGKTLDYLFLQPNTDESTVYLYEDLDLYSDIPIKISKSFAEIQDISKRNSDYSIGLKLPGSKKNNRFFENFFNVDARSLFFDVTKRVPCKVLLDDEIYFNGYLRLNKTSVQNSSVEYDVTLYSTIGDLFGKIGNNLLKDLDFYDNQYLFNHEFNYLDIASQWGFESIFEGDNPPNYIYPIVHNGYEYTTGGTVNISGGTPLSQTRLYTSTIVGSWATSNAGYSAGVKRYRINSYDDGLLANQLKPALNIGALIKLIFKTYGYTIKSEFFNNPWFKLLYTYGYFSSTTTKFGYKVPQAPSFPVENVELYLKDNGDKTFSVIVVKEGTGSPVACQATITVMVRFAEPIYTFPITYIYHNYSYTIPAGQTIITENFPNVNYFVTNIVNSGSTANQTYNLDYTPQAVNSSVVYEDGDQVNFSLVIDEKIKQIDFLSSIAKKFNLVFIPDTENPNQIIIEPFQYYIGTGNIYDWTDKISYDKGFNVEPALNFVESDLLFTDLDDGDFGNQEFKNRNNRIYGENNVYNTTDFKSQTKKIETIFSPEVLRQWDTIDTAPNGEIELPLGINYALTTVSINSGGSQIVNPQYLGVKTKPKLFYYLGNFSPFINEYKEVWDFSGYKNTNFVYLASTDDTERVAIFPIPIVSHTMPIGNPDSNKITNDSISNLFKSEQITNIGITAFDAYSENDVYSLFYESRINNLYDFNTRFLKGYFNLKLSDIKNLKPNDLIKINEQYFTWNKIDGYNLTNPELTMVELIQCRNNVSEYPTRYFMYYYCDNPSTIFKFETDMTNPSLSGTSYGWSVLYDYNIGVLTGATKTGYTSTIRNNDLEWVPYYIYEVDETTYNSTGTGRTYDPVWNAALPDLNPYNYRGYVTNSGSTKMIMNVFQDCTDFSNTASSIGIKVGSSGTIPPIVYSSGITINVTTIGYIKYNTAGGQIYRYVSSTGNYDIPDCADCNSIIPGIPLANVASFTISDCGTPCP